MNSVQRQDSVLLNENLQFASYQASNGQVVQGQKSYKKVQSKPVAANITFGSNYVILPVERNGEYEWLSDARIIITIPAITGAGGTYIRGVNALALFMHQDWVLLVDQKPKKRISARQVFEQLYKNVDSDRWERIKNDIGYETNTATRNTNASSAQYFSINLKWLFNFFAKPVDISSYKDIEIRCYLKSDKRQCIQTDKTAPVFTFTDYYLDCQYIEPIRTITKMNRDLVDNKKSPVIFDFEYIQKDFPIASGSTIASLDLSYLVDKNVIDLAFELIPAAQIDTNDTSDYTDANTAITSHNLKSGNKYITNLEEDVTTNYYNRAILPRLHYLGIKQIVGRTNPAQVISFAHDYGLSDIDRVQKFHGYKSFIDIKDAKLNLTFSALGSNHIATVYARCPKLLVNNLGLLEEY